MNVNFIFFSIFLFFFTLTGTAQTMEAFYSRAFFIHPEDGPFMESYLAINGSSIIYKPNEDGNLQGKVEVTTLYFQKDSIVFYDKYEVRSPIIEKKKSKRGNFIDVQRVPVPVGVYQLEMQIKDLNNDGTIKPFLYHDVLVVADKGDSLSISDIELVESFQRTEERNEPVKGGVQMVPYTSNFYHEDIKTLIFYMEIYNTIPALGQDQTFLLYFYIESQDSDQKLGEYTRFKKEKAGDVVVLFNQFAIGTLPSGNYNLVVEVRDRNNAVVDKKKLFFQRSNPNLPIKTENLASMDLSNSFVMNIPSDSLHECISCLGPISSTSERQYAETQIKVGDHELMRRYIQHFWEKRSRLEPESLWLAYSVQVQKVGREYERSIKKGYETDQGRVYLQYGQPNSVEARNMDPALYPYEIWHYYKINTMSNAKFIFYDPDFVDMGMELLHSNVSGEPSDPSWHYKLQNLRPNNVDQLFNNDLRNRATEFWSNPK